MERLDIVIISNREFRSILFRKQLNKHAVHHRSLTGEFLKFLFSENKRAQNGEKNEQQEMVMGVAHTKIM